MTMIAALTIATGCGDSGGSGSDSKNNKAADSGSNTGGNTTGGANSASGTSLSADEAARRRNPYGNQRELDESDKAAHGLPPLVDKIPGDAVLYIGWRGSRDLGEGYDQSHLKAVLDKSNVGEIFTKVLPKLAGMLNDQDPSAGMILNTILSIGGKLWQYPSALYVGKVEFGEGKSPLPPFAVFCQAGDDSNALAKQLNDMFKQLQGPLKATSANGMVTISAGPLPDAGGTLANSAVFNQAIKQVRGGQSFVAYLDAESILQIVDNGITSIDDPELIKMWRAGSDALGLNGLKRAVFSSGLNGRDWSNHMFIQAPSPRKGLMAMLDGEPISDDMLKAVPKYPVSMMAFRMDIGKFVGAIRNAIDQFAPAPVKEEINNAIAAANDMVGIDIEKDLLGSLGDEWMVYTDNTVAGSGMLGMTILNRLRDADKFASSLVKVQNTIQAIANSQLEDANMTVQFRQAEMEGVKMHYLATPVITPAWTVHEDKLVASFYPQVIVGAMRHLRDPGESILDNKQYLAAIKRLAGDKLSASGLNSISYFDLPQTVHEGYQIMLLASRLYLGFADLFGLEAPAIVIPPLPTLVENVTVSAGVSWADDKGWYAVSVMPFPGAEMFASSQSGMVVGQMAMAAGSIGVMLPALGAARKTARNIQAESNMRQVLNAMVAYQVDNARRLPPNLGTLVIQRYLADAQALHAANSSKKILTLRDVRGRDKEQAAVVLSKSSDFAYVPVKGSANKIRNPSAHVVLFQRNPYRENDINVGFLDGHTEQMSIRELSALIRKQTGEDMSKFFDPESDDGPHPSKDKK